MGAALNIGSATRLGALQVGDFGSAGLVTQTGGIVTAYGSFNVGNQGGTGTYNLSGGSFILRDGLCSLGRATASAATAGIGTINLSGTGLLDVQTGNFIVGDRDLPGLQGTGVVNQTGGIFRVGSGATLHLGGYGSSTYHLNGGTLEVGGSSLQSNFNGSANGQFNLGGGTVKVIGSDLVTAAAPSLVAATASTIDPNGFNATFQNGLGGTGSRVNTGAGNATVQGAFAAQGLAVQQGAMLLNGASQISGEANVGGGSTLGGSGSLDLATTSTLKGTGTLDVATIARGGFAPGNSPGILTIDADFTLESTATYEWELTAHSVLGAGVNFDQALVTGGDFTIVSGAELALVFGAGVDFTNAFWQTVASGTVIDATGADLFTFGGVNITNVSNIYGDFSVAEQSEALQLTWTPTAVPEPSSFRAVVSGAALLLGLQRRRRRAEAK